MMNTKVLMALFLFAVVLQVRSASLGEKFLQHLKLQRQKQVRQAVPPLPVQDDYNPLLPNQDGKSGSSSNTYMTCHTSDYFHCHGCFFTNGQCCCPNYNTGYED